MQPDERGLIPVPLLLGIPEWMQADQRPGAASLDFYPNGAQVDAETFAPRGVAQSFDLAFQEGGFRTNRQDLLLLLPLFFGVPLELPLEAASIQSPALRPELFDGFSSSGTITGYLTDVALLNLVADVQELCGGGNPPPECQQINAILPPGTPPQDAVAQLLPLIGGYDALVANGGAFPCGAGQCNAISVCFAYTSVGIRVPAQ